MGMGDILGLPRKKYSLREGMGGAHDCECEEQKVGCSLRKECECLDIELSSFVSVIYHTIPIESCQPRYYDLRTRQRGAPAAQFAYAPVATIAQAAAKLAQAPTAI